MAIIFIGGASGVGKTSLLRSVNDIEQINTGDLFKKEMTIGNRDDIKKGDWSIFEKEVAEAMSKIASISVKNNSDLIIDTHFAAKILNRNYRIGIKEEFLQNFWLSVIDMITEKMNIFIVLITTDPYSLLSRRRLDTSRKRELIASDCYNTLRSNDLYSYRYLSVLRKVMNTEARYESMVNSKFYIIENNEFTIAQKQLINIIKGEV